MVSGTGADQAPKETTEAEPGPDAPGRFVFGKRLGVGTFSVVRLATHSVTKLNVAVKILDRDKIEELGTEERVQREINHLRRCARHPHVMRLYRVLETPAEIWLVNECVGGGDLYDYMTSKESNRLCPDEARRFFQQLVSGVDFLHAQKICHRDLKLENVLLDGNHVNLKIADFGLSGRISEGELLRTACGSPHYAAPEVISSKPYVGERVDVWSCGVILYGMLCGYLPFNEKTIPATFRKIQGGVYSLPGHLSEEERDMIQRMLEVDTEERVTVPEIRQHPLFRRDLPSYLRPPTEAAETRSGGCVDSEVVSQILKLYDGHACLPRDKKAARGIVERAVAVGYDDGGGGTEIARDLRFAYDILLDRKNASRRAREADDLKGKLPSGSRTSALSSFFCRKLLDAAGVDVRAPSRRSWRCDRGGGLLLLLTLAMIPPSIPPPVPPSSPPPHFRIRPLHPRLCPEEGGEGG